MNLQKGDFSDGDAVEELVTDLSWVRRKYNKKPLQLAVDLEAAICNNGVYACAVTVKNSKGSLTIRDNINNTYKTRMQHSFVYVGDYIIDILNFDTIIKTEAYISMLKSLNSDLVISKAKTSRLIQSDIGKKLVEIIENRDRAV